MSLTPGAKLGPYDVIALIGAGGMGEVYKAHDPRLGRTVALKLLPAALTSDPDRRARFEREARAAAALSHPNICTIYDIGEAGRRLFIAMEHLDGATLSDCLVHGPAPMAIGEVLDIGIQITDAFNEARKHHIVHRDLKSANVMLLPRGQVKILDFGLAKRVVPDPDEVTTVAHRTDAGMVVGTAAYMSPEQALGREVDYRSDLFACGVVLYELLTGRVPFAGRTSMEFSTRSSMRRRCRFRASTIGRRTCSCRSWRSCSRKTASAGISRRTRSGATCGGSRTTAPAPV